MIQQSDSEVPGKGLGMTPTQLAAVVEGFHDAVVVATLDGTITSWNVGATKIFGYSAEETIGKSIFLIIPPEVEEEIRTSLDTVKSGGMVDDHDSVRWRKDGSRVEVSVSCSPVRSEDGVIVSVLCIERDISERKRLEKELLRVSENRYRAVCTASRDAIMTLEPPSWKFTSGNPATLEMFRVRNEEEFVSYDPGELSPEKQPDGRPSKEKALEMIEQAMREGYSFFEWTHRRANGEEFPAEVSLSRVDYGEKPFLQAIVRDITERKRIEEKLREYSEEKFKAVFDSAHDGMVLADSETKKLSFANAAFGKMLGYSQEEIKDLLVSDIHPEKDLPHVLEQFERQARGEISLAEGLPVKRKDGSVFYADINSSPLKVNGKSFLLGIFRDITERKKAEDILLESRDELNRLLNSMAEGVYGVDVNGNCTFANQSFLQMLGYQNESEVIGKHTHELMHYAYPDGSFYPESECKMYLSSRENKPVHVSDEVFWRKDKTSFPVEYWSHPVIKNGVVTGAIATFFDITKAKEAEQHICELNEVRDKFIDIISHQLRTPLTSVNWNLEMLLNGDFGKLDDTQRKFLQATHAASIQITNRIHNLLTAMDVEEGRVRYVTENIAFDSLCTEIVNDLFKSCDLKSLTCTYPAVLGEVPPVYGDPAKLRAVITALVENAIEYTKDGGTVSVKLSMQDDTVRFEVKDTGVGIPAQEQHHVFTRFFRASNASVMQPDAFGLSLFVAKNFIDQHHGTIGFESKEGEGSTFWFEVPASRRTVGGGLSYI